MIISQGLLLLIFACAGLFIGTAQDVFDLVKHICKDNIVVITVCDIVWTVASGIAILYLFAVYCMGIIRLYLLLTTVLALIVQRKTLSKLFAYLAKLVYNHNVKVVSKLKDFKLTKPLFK